MMEKLYEPDVHELENFKRQRLLNTITTTGIASVAPYLSLARIADSSAAIGMVASSRIEDVRVLSRKSYNILQINLFTETEMNNERKHIHSTVYTFKNISPTTFEPFVLINVDDKNRQWVFAYASDDEFIMEEIAGNEQAIANEINLIVKKRNFRSLARYVGLLITH